MNSEDQMKRYLNIVKKELNDTLIGEMIEKELLNHMEDQLEELLANGISEEEAIEIILCQMGDPKKLGISFRKVHIPRQFVKVILLGAVTLGLYTGNIAGYVDFSSFLLVTVCAAILFYFFLYKRNRWANKKESWSDSFLYSGIIVALVSCLLAAATQNWKEGISNLILLPFWYGLLFCTFINIIKMLGDRIHNRNQEECYENRR